ncbi:MAG TPA: hypothetical protein VFT27_11070 [Actinomycetota bacterium]|nr:hypothetical protein [Actinomycetota bacterium]
MPSLGELLDRESRTVDLEHGDFERLRDRRDRRQRNRRIRAGALAVVVMLVGAAVFLRALRSEPTLQPAPQPTGTPGPSVWSFVHERSDLTVHRGRAWQDPHDAPVGWIDVERVRFSAPRYTNGDFQPGWYIELAAKPPAVADREPGLLVAYGLVLETTGDGVADYLVGIDNDASEGGDFHVWVTDLATGETDEQIGPPYGSPIDFSHPDEQGSGPNMSFFFLPGSAPADLNPKTVRFYAWASASRGGEVFATDYAPDAGWLTSAPGGPDTTTPRSDPSPTDQTSRVCENPGWPSTSRNAPGVYSWDGPGPGGDGSHLEGFMHNGYGTGDVEISVGVVPEGVIPDESATAVIVAGRDGLYRRIDAQREEWIVDIEGTTITIHLTARPGASQADLADAQAIIGSMRTVPCDNEIGFELLFTLTTNDWDSG